MEVLESTLPKDNEPAPSYKTESGDSVYTDSEKESYDSDGSYSTKGAALLQKIKSRINASYQESLEMNTKLNSNITEDIGRRRSGPIKQVSMQVEKNSIINMKKNRKAGDFFLEDDEDKIISEETESKPRKSILKYTRRLSGPIPDNKQIYDIRPISTDSIITEDTETSGYRSNSSSRHNEMSESESDYGYSTITESTTPKRVELSAQSKVSYSSGVLPDETWTTIQTRAVDWSGDEDEMDEPAARPSIARNLYDSHQFLCSTGFMNNFVDHFIVNLGTVLGMPQDVVRNALTQGASVYCDMVRNNVKIGNEVFPALIASWPNTANQWIIRERKIIQNPRTNFTYQWPTKYMVSKAIGFGCVLVPIGFRPKRGVNDDQGLQWKIIFPAAERYLESCLAHAHMRCYLFALALHKSFLEKETLKIGIDASHLKNHLFWQCEDNYASWPEHRLGETLRMFLRSFYIHFGQGRYPNYFVESCNDFKSIPKPVLLTQQRRLADILEAPVMHILSAIDKLKYTKKEFYPTFNVHRLYDILTSKNPLRIMNPNLPAPIPNYVDTSESENEETDLNFWDKAKRQDKHYQWKKEKQRQLQERRKAQTYSRKQRASMKQEREIKTNVSIFSYHKYGIIN